MPTETPSLESENAEFWNELCGTGLARHLGITDHSIESLKRFDDYYFEIYPYLLRRVPVATMAGKRVLEVGLGYGSLGQKIAESGADYVGLDIAAGPVTMMMRRLRMQALGGTAQQGSMLSCPLPDASVDCVVSIGCFHHTGSTQRCIDESFRVLRPGGHAYIMVYNQFSLRQWLRWPGETAGRLLAARKPAGPSGSTASQRSAYDADSAGTAAPATEFFSVGELRRMFGRFSSFEAALENCDDIARNGRILVSRKVLLPLIGRWMGLDIYVAARK